MNELNRLVLFGSRIGLNFSGGSNATVKLFQHIVPEFKEVYVVAKEIGPLEFSGAYQHIAWKDKKHAVQILKSLYTKPSIFYGDFWDSIYIVQAGIPFFFTYHDNWPEQKYLNLSSWFSSFQIENQYRKIFKAAEHVFSVTQHKRSYIDRSTHNHSLVRNGSCMKASKFSIENFKGIPPFKILMLGNLDRRKYKLALEVFSALDPEIQKIIQVDIYGHTIRPNLLKKLLGYSFIQYKGFSPYIDYKPYHLFLSTSQSENLPISMLESIINYTPVLSFNIGGIAELIEHGKDGVLVSPYDCKKMAKELKKILNGSYSFSFNREKLNIFDWKNSAELMLDRFRSRLHV